MVDSYYPSTEELLAGQRARRTLVFGLMVGIVLFVLAIVGGMGWFLPKIQATTILIVGLSAFLCLAVPIVVWQNPRIGLYIAFAGVLMCGNDPSKIRATIPTSMIPLTWNVSIIAQTYGGTTALNGFSFSPMELLLIWTFLVWFIRAVVSKDLKMVGGAFFSFIFAYMATVLMGLINGVGHGGNITIALWEIRQQFIFFFAYLLTANILTKREHMMPLLYMGIICPGIVALTGVITYYTQGSGTGRMEDGILGLGHEDSLYFNVSFFVLFLLVISRVNQKLTKIAYILLPTTVAALMLNQRRACIGAFIIAFIPMLPILWQIMPERRKQLKKFITVFAVINAIYMPIAWNGNGAWALPARAIRSQLDPQGRDLASNNYREAENINLKFTRDVSPFIGYGYGRPFIYKVPLPMIYFPLKDFLPHNSVLWVWMRVGHVGFFCLIMVFGAVLIKGIHVLREVRDPIFKVVGILAIVNMLMLFVYGKYDLQFNSPRSMTLAGLLVGVLAMAHKHGKELPSRQETEEAEEAEFTPTETRPLNPVPGIFGN